MQRILILAEVASIAFGAGSILFFAMVVLWTPSAAPYFVMFMPLLVEMPLIAGGAILTRNGVVEMPKNTRPKYGRETKVGTNAKNQRVRYCVGCDRK